MRNRCAVAVDLGIQRHDGVSRLVVFVPQADYIHVARQRGRLVSHLAMKAREVTKEVWRIRHTVDRGLEGIARVSESRVEHLELPAHVVRLADHESTLFAPLFRCEIPRFLHGIRFIECAPSQSQSGFPRDIVVRVDRRDIIDRASGRIRREEPTGSGDKRRLRASQLIV